MERENEKNTTTGKPDVNFCFHRKHVNRFQYTHKQYHGSEKCCHGRDSAMKSNTTGLNNSARGYFALLITIIT